MEQVAYTEKLRAWNRKDVEKFGEKAPVTTPYPFIDIEKPPEYRGIPHINPEKCIGCGACVNACPPDALILEWDKEHGVKRLTFNAAPATAVWRSARPARWSRPPALR